jgi:hypothetical protein
MKILFAMSSPEYLRFYDTTIVELAARGHEVVLAAGGMDDRKPVRFDALGAANGVRVAGLVPSRGDIWPAFARWVRGTMDWARYLHPRLASAATLRARMKRQGLPLLFQWADRIRSVRETRLRTLMRTLAACERAIPVAQTLLDFLDTHRPDLVLVSPLVEAASEQVDLVRAARARGIRTAAMIASWDNLTNKGDLRVAPDRVVVWNEAQKREAVELHRVRPENVVVTGSQVFDRWFGRAPSRERGEFCAMVGLPVAKPFVLFVGSSVFISRVEVPFVRRWIEALRASSDPAVRDIAVLIRPHPYNGAQWADADVRGLADVAVWPRGKHNPVDELNRSDFFDSMHHSVGVVGVNTSAMIEAAIVGRPVFSILTPEFSGSQEGTLHFHHLLPENGGFLRVAGDLDEHVTQLGAVLRHPDAARNELASFVRSFVRPHGTDRACAPMVVDAIEQLGRAPAPRAAGDTVSARVTRAAFYPVALFAAVFPEEALRKRRGAKWARERWRKAVRSWERRTKALRARRTGQRAGSIRSTPSLSLMLCAVVPFLAAMLLVAWFGVSELSGRTPFAYEPPANVVEAAGMGLSADVLRFLRAGQQPNAPMYVRPHIISSEVTQVTASEAAVWSRRVRLMELLEHERALDDPALRWHLICLAADLRAWEVHEFISSHVSAPQCEPGAAVRRVAARSN